MRVSRDHEMSGSARAHLPRIKKSGPDMQVWLKEKHISGMSVVPSHLRTMSGGGAPLHMSSSTLRSSSNATFCNAVRCTW